LSDRLGPHSTTGGGDEDLIMDLKLEVVTLPMSDVDRARRFYDGLG
jgi:hypothetical protein